MTLFAITNYHWPICRMIDFILFVRLSFSILAFTTGSPIYLVSNKGGCDRPAENTYIFVAPDPAFAFLGGPCCPTLDFVFFLSDYDCVLHVMSSTWNWFHMTELPHLHRWWDPNVCTLLGSIFMKILGKPKLFNFSLILYKKMS
jgi:hypothetical protein